MHERPYLLVSCAMSVDGYIDDASQDRLVLSSDEDLDRVDEVRASCDAIFVGAGTIRRDDPRLVIRSSERRARRLTRGAPEDPVKVTITATGDLDPSARFFTTGRAARLVYCARPALETARARLSEVAEVIDAGDSPSPVLVLCDLAERGVASVLLEGGGQLAAEFLAADLADELHLVVAPFFVGDPAAPRFAVPGGYPHGPANRMRLAEVRLLGEVVLLRYLLGTRPDPRPPAEQATSPAAAEPVPLPAAAEPGRPPAAAEAVPLPAAAPEPEDPPAALVPRPARSPEPPSPRAEDIQWLRQTIERLSTETSEPPWPYPGQPPALQSHREQRHGQQSRGEPSHEPSPGGRGDGQPPNGDPGPAGQSYGEYARAESGYKPPPGGRSQGGRTYDDRSSAGRPHGAQPPGGRSQGGRTYDDRSSAGRPHGAQPPGGRSQGGRTYDDQSSAGRPHGAQPPGGRSQGERAYDDRSSAGRPHGAQPPGGRSQGERAYDDQSSAGRPHGGPPPGGQQPRGRSYGAQPAGEQHHGERTYGGQPGAAADVDVYWLRETIELSRRCPPSQTAFSVGAVIVGADGRPLATGFSREADPRDHAEEAALNKLPRGDPRLAGATLYSSLEPCGVRASRPRPCAELIIAAGLRRVVYAWREPPLLATGGGDRMLRAAGVSVTEVPELAAEARQVNAHLTGSLGPSTA